MFTSWPTPSLASNINPGKWNHSFYWLTEIGRKNVCTLNGLTLLHKFSTHCPEDKSYDPLLARVCYIINICLDRKQLPIQSTSSPATFTLPTVKEVYSYNETDIRGMSFISQYLVKHGFLTFFVLLPTYDLLTSSIPFLP